jgi:hypothetical protein
MRVLVLLCAAASLAAHVNSTRKQPPCDLDCWLGNLTLHLPAVYLEADTFALNVSNLTCDKIGIVGITSEGAFASFYVSLQGASVNCTAAWTLSQSLDPDPLDYGVALVYVNQTELALALQYFAQAPPEGLVSALAVHNCTVTFNVALVELQGNWYAQQAWNLFHIELAEAISFEANRQLCQQIEVFVQSNVSAAAMLLHDLLQPYAVSIRFEFEFR